MTEKTAIVEEEMQAYKKINLDLEEQVKTAESEKLAFERTVVQLQRKVNHLSNINVMLEKDLGLYVE